MYDSSSVTPAPDAADDRQRPQRRAGRSAGEPEARGAAGVDPDDRPAREARCGAAVEVERVGDRRQGAARQPDRPGDGEVDGVGPRRRVGVDQRLPQRPRPGVVEVRHREARHQHPPLHLLDPRAQPEPPPPPALATLDARPRPTAIPGPAHRFASPSLSTLPTHCGGRAPSPCLPNLTRESHGCLIESFLPAHPSPMMAGLVRDTANRSPLVATTPEVRSSGPSLDGGRPAVGGPAVRRWPESEVVSRKTITARIGFVPESSAPVRWVRFSGANPGPQAADPLRGRWPPRADFLLRPGPGTKRPADAGAPEIAARDRPGERTTAPRGSDECNCPVMSCIAHWVRSGDAPLRNWVRFVTGLDRTLGSFRRRRLRGNWVRFVSGRRPLDARTDAIAN